MKAEHCRYFGLTINIDRLRASVYVRGGANRARRADVRTELSINHSEFRRWELFTAPLNGCRIRRAVFLLPCSTNTTAIKDSEHHKAFPKCAVIVITSPLSLSDISTRANLRSLLELFLFLMTICFDPVKVRLSCTNEYCKKNLDNFLKIGTNGFFSFKPL